MKYLVTLHLDSEEVVNFLITENWKMKFIVWLVCVQDRDWLHTVAW